MTNFYKILDNGKDTGAMYACEDPEFVGTIPIRTEIEALPADEPRMLRLGWTVEEHISYGVININGLSRSRRIRQRVYRCY